MISTSKEFPTVVVSFHVILEEAVSYGEPREKYRAPPAHRQAKSLLYVPNCLYPENLWLSWIEQFYRGL
jgi:hypothetical protein